MFRLAFEDRYRVFLARFTGIYVSEDVTDLQRVLTSFVAEHGPVHGLFDYTEVEAVAVPQSLIAHHAGIPQISPGYERVFVTPLREMYDLARAYAVQQRELGNKEPQIVTSMWDAYRLLGLDRPNFREIR
jgi:hypothetical protein